MTTPPPNQDMMVSRLRPDHVTAQPFTTPDRSPATPPFRIVISAADGAELLVMTEENGRLAVSGDEAHWGEAAARFIHAMMQWSGQAGLNWREEATRAAGK